MPRFSEHCLELYRMFFRDGLTGCAWGDWSLYDASLFRALLGIVQDVLPGWAHWL